MRLKSYVAINKKSLIKIFILGQEGISEKFPIDAYESLDDGSITF